MGSGRTEIPFYPESPSRAWRWSVKQYHLRTDRPPRAWSETIRGEGCAGGVSRPSDDRSPWRRGGGWTSMLEHLPQGATIVG